VPQPTAPSRAKRQGYMTGMKAQNY
jgi:hypothetical protein